MHFISSYIIQEKNSEPAWWFIFQNDKILIHESNGSVRIPKIQDAELLGIEPIRQQYIGTMDGTHCYACETDIRQDSVPSGMKLVSLRMLFSLLPDDLFWIAARASLIMYWDSTSRFCGRCGHPTKMSDTETRESVHYLRFYRLSQDFSRDHCGSGKRQADFAWPL